MSELELALRESDGRPITWILKNRMNQTLKTIPLSPSPPAAQGKAELMKYQGIFFFVLSVDFEKEQSDININLHSFHIQEQYINELRVPAVLLQLLAGTSAGSSQRPC